MAEPGPLSGCGADFRDAAIAALEEARRGLVWEHERVLARCEADLRNEIERLQQELSTARAETETGFQRAVSDVQELSTARAETETGFQRVVSNVQDGAAVSSHSLCGCEGCGRLLPYESVPLWGASVGPGWMDGEAYKLEKQPSAGHDDTDWSGNTPQRKAQDRDAAKGDEGPPASPGDTYTPRGFLRTSHRSHATSGSSEEPHKVTWKRTADTVILKAGSDFFGEATSEMDFSKYAFYSRIRQDRYFQIRLVESFMGFVIVLNTLTLGMSSEIKPQWLGWIAIDSIFAGMFTFELVWKLFILGCKGYYWGTEWRWNDFEFVLVILAWIEVASAISQADAGGGGTSKSSLFRMLRLMRLAKLLRILRLQIFCDLLMMVNGAIGSWKTLLYSMVLIFIPLYGVSLVLKETLGAYASSGEGAESFDHLGQAFFTLFRCIVAGECTQEDGKPIFVMVTKAYGWSFGLVYCLVQFFMTFGLFNVIVAIYVENTVSAAKYNDITVKRQRLRDRAYFEVKAQDLLKLIWRYHCEFRELTQEQMANFDEDAAGKLQLTQEFFEELIAQQPFTDLLRDLDISDDDQLDLFETLDVEGTGAIDLLDFVIGIGKLRGEARKADVIAVGLMLRSLQNRLAQLERSGSGRASSRKSIEPRESVRTTCREPEIAGTIMPADPQISTCSV